MNRVGHLLYELSHIESEHPRSVVDWIEFRDDSSAHLGIAGTTARIDLTAGKAASVEALHSVVTRSPPVGMDRPLTTVDQDRHLLWVALLHDLGLYSADMASISRTRTAGRMPLRYQRIERCAGEVLIIVTNIHERLMHQIELDATALPVAVPVDIAMHWHPQEEVQAPSSAWTHPIRAWLRRLTN